LKKFKKCDPSSISLKFGKLPRITEIYEKHRALILRLSQSLLELCLSQSLLTSKTWYSVDPLL